MLLTSRRHVQLLLHLATSKETQKEDLRRVPSPLTLLYRYLDLFGAHVIPLLPHLHNGPTEHDNPRTPDWLAWLPNGALERAVRSRVLQSTRHGIWTFLWEPIQRKSQRTPKKRKKRRADSDDEEDEARVLSEEGWMVLEWLVALWSTSPSAILDQLPKLPGAAKLQNDNASVPLAIVAAAFLPTDPPTPLNVLYDRRATASKLLSLIIDLARPPKAQFHAQSLVLSLVALFRVPSKQIPALCRAIPDWNARAHILAVVLEDAAGVRKEREAARRSAVASRAGSRAASVAGSRGALMTAPRSRSTTVAVEDVQGKTLSTPFQAPDVDYALDLLSLEGDEHSPAVAAELVSTLVANMPKDDAWLRLDEAFIEAHSHNGVLARILIMARKRSDIACGREPADINVKVEFPKPHVKEVDVDVKAEEETQETVPLTASQLAEAAKDEYEEESQLPAPPAPQSDSELTDLSDDGEGSLPAETLPMSKEQRAQFGDDEDDNMEADDEGSDAGSVPAETMPLSKAQRAEFDSEDEELAESQLPAETLPLSRQELAQYDDDDEMESQRR